MINKIFALVLIFAFILPKTLNAQQQEFDYEHLTAGSCLTSDGFFFTEQGMVALVVNTREKIRLATLDGQKQIDLLKLDLKTCGESKEIQLRIQKEMFQKQLAIKQSVIDSYEQKSYLNNIILTSSIILSLTAGFFVGKLFIVK